MYPSVGKDHARHAYSAYDIAGYHRRLVPPQRHGRFAADTPVRHMQTMTTDSLALDFKSATLYAVRVVLHQADLAALTAALDKRMHDAGSLFENEPVVIDASRVDAVLDWPALVSALRTKNLPVIGAITHPSNADGAQVAGLATVELSTPPSRPSQNNAAVTTEALDAPLPTQAATGIATGTVSDTTDAGDTPPRSEPAGSATVEAAQPPVAENESPALQRAAQPGQDASAPAARAPQSSSALVITKPLRSGQRVYARHTDLIVIGMVSQGAEVIADGNIHVYGPLRGKAIAGARGDTAARIFTTELDAELLAIAGVYRVVESRLDAQLRNRPTLVRLEGDTLRVESLKP